MKKIYVIAYNHSNNIGDNIQSYVTSNLLEKIGYEVHEIDQNSLHKGLGEEITVFINGFFCFEDNNFDTNFPFHKSITPIFYNFHLELDYGKDLNIEKSFFTPKNISYFKKHEPIGCRDEETQKVFSTHGINAINNECITLLLEKRTTAQEKGAKKIILVDVDNHIPLPPHIKEYDYLTHTISHGPFISNATKFAISQDVLEYYKNNAKLIVTSRFHCAMPCIAMGIPVVMLGEKNKRLDQRYVNIYPYIHWSKRHLGLLRKNKTINKIPVLKKHIRFGFTLGDILFSIIYKIYLHVLYKLGFIKINWDVQAPEIEASKKQKIEDIKKRLKGT